MTASAVSAPVGVTVVEDDRATMETFIAVLSDDGRVCVVDRARTRAAAIASLERRCPDVLLVDLGLPDGSGIDVIRHARATCPGCDVMVVSMFGDEQNVLRSIEAGATGYVLKDVGATELVETVLTLRAGGAPMSPGIARLVLTRLRAAAHDDEHPPTPAPPAILTPREVDVLSALSRGYTYGEIASRLNISLHTVTSHIKSSYRKLAVHSGAAAVTRARELGLLFRRSGRGAGGQG